MAAASAVVAAALAPSAAAADDPANQPPFGGEQVPPLVERGGDSPPPGFELGASEAQGIASETAEVRDLYEADGEPDSDFQRLGLTVATRGDETWEVRVRRSGEREVRAIVVVDDATGQVVDVFTGSAIETKLARGYEGAVGGKASSWWIWLPLCALFIAPFFDPRRPLRLLHLDLLALLGLSVSLFFFDRGEIEWSVLWVYPVLAYVFVRMLVVGFHGVFGRAAAGAGARRAEFLVPVARRSWLVGAVIGLACFHVGYQSLEGKVIDVGVASAIGADRLTSGEDVYGEDFGEELPERGDVRGDVYGPVNYLAYSPFELALPWEDEWDDVPAAQAAAVAFTLLTALALFALGQRLRNGEEGGTLGVALAFAWLAYPFTLYTAASSFNDSLVALLVACSLLAVASPPARGALAALAGLTKFGPLALAPLLAAGTGDRRPRTLVLFAAAFAVTAAIVTFPAIPDGGLREIYDRSLGYQASRGSPFSIWGQAPALEPLQTASKVFAVGLAVLVFFVPRRRTLPQLAALAAAVLVAVQLTSSHWLYPYAVWFLPLVLAAVFAAYRPTRSLDTDTDQP
ncbi:MAG: hypothetical protein K0S15_1826 [Solirubrobacterales bacterium]|nr:hypothetical protein [Solirubrobacterales bacterium]